MAYLSIDAERNPLVNLKRCLANHIGGSILFAVTVAMLICKPHKAITCKQT